MLAVFEHSVSRPPPEFVIHKECSKLAKNRQEMAELFSSESLGISTLYNFTNGNFMALSHRKQDPRHPRSMVAKDDVFCMFAGSIDNMCHLRRHYGLSRHTTEAMMVVEMYKVLRDRAPYPPDQLLVDLAGNFAFLLFDAATGVLFAARDPDGGVPFFWGVADDGSLAISDDSRIILDLCGGATAHFPPGCMYSNNDGLASFVHPMNKVRAVISSDEQDGQFSILFQVDLLDRLPSIPHVGSDANWENAFASGGGSGGGD